MKTFILSIILAFCTIPIYPEKSDSIKIWGHVCDAFTMHGLIDGVQVELLDKDKCTSAKAAMEPGRPHGIILHNGRIKRGDIYHPGQSS